MAVFRTMFLRFLMILAVALVVPVYFAVSSLLKMKPVLAESLRSKPLLSNKLAVVRSQSFPLPKETDADSSAPSGVFLKAVRLKHNSDRRLPVKESRTETSSNSKDRKANDHNLKILQNPRVAETRPSSFPDNPPRNQVDALKEKYKNENYRQSCKFLKTSMGLQRICYDRYKNGSKGKLMAKAIMKQREYFIKKPVLRPAAHADVDKHVMDSRSESSAKEDQFKKLEPPKMRKAPEKYRRRGVVATKPPKSKPSTRGILSYTPWVSYIDAHDYKYLVNPGVDTCTDDGFDTRVDLLVLVTSHPEHAERRDVIRETWGAFSPMTTTLSPIVKVLFLLGVTTLGAELGTDLQREVDRHGDIVVEEFLESYLNLTTKTVMGLKWASRYCPGARFVMKTDDDVVLNMPRLLAYLHTTSHRAVITGRLAKAYPVLRDPWEKFYVPEDVYSKETYPDYCVGLGYIMSMDVVHRLYLQSLLIPLFPWEDVYIGILLKHIGIIPRDIRNFYYFLGSNIFDGNTIVDPIKTLFRLNSYYVLDGLTPEQTRILWKQWQPHKP